MSKKSRLRQFRPPPAPEIRQRYNHAGYQRRLTIEVLEPRWLLSLTNAAIDDTQKDIITGGLSGLATWANLLDEHDLASQLLPVVGQSAGEALDLADILNQGLAARIADYFAADSDPTTDELVTAIQGLSFSSFDNVTLFVTNVTGGQSTVLGENELVFNLTFFADRSLTTNVSLGPQGDALGIDFSSQVAAGADFLFDFSFGVDLTSGLSEEQAFFIRASGLDIGVDSFSPSLPSGPMSIGFYGATLSSGFVLLDASLSVSLNNPDGDAAGNITLAELQETAMSTLVSLSGGGSSSGSVTASLGSFGTFSPSGSPTISFTSSNPFVGPSLSFNAAYDQVRNFTNISSFSYLGVLEQLGVFLDGLSDSNVLDANVQLASQSRIGHLIDLGGVLRKGLIEKLVDMDGVPTFATVQELASDLETVLGLPTSTIAANYNPTSRELTLHFIVDHVFAPSMVPLGIDLDLSPVSGFTSTSEATLNADGSLEFTLGVDLNDASAVMVATTAAPANGQILADANFTLSTGFSGQVAVTLTQAATSDNSNRSHLVTDMTAALAAAGLSGSVVVALDSNNRLTLSTAAAPSGLAALELRAADYNPQGPPSSNPIVTELGFRERHFAFDSLANHAFVEGATVDGSVSLSSSNIVGTAAVGFLNVDITGGTGTSQANFTLEIKDPVTQVAGGRAQLFDMLSALATDPTEVVDVPQLSGPIAITLAIDTTIFGAPLTTSPELVISWADISAGTPSVTLVDGDELLAFEHLSSGDFATALDDLGSYLNSLEDHSFFGMEIPAISKSFGELASFSAQFREFVIAFQNNPAAALDDLEGALEEAIGLDDDDLDISLVENGDVIRVDLVIVEEFVKQIPIALEFPFEDLFGNEIVELLVDLRGSALLNVDLDLEFQLSFGIDISNSLSLVPFIYESSYLTAKAEVNAQNIEFDANILFWGIHVRDGVLLIDEDGLDITRDQAVLDIQLTDNNPGTSEGKISLTSIDLDNVDVDLTGQLHVVLPIYYPDLSTFVGNLELTITDLGDIAGTTTLIIPDLEEEDEEDEEEEEDNGLLDNLTGILNGLDTWFRIAIDAFNGKVGSVELPFVGKDLGKVADFLEQVHEDVISQITDRFHETEGDTGAALQTALFLAVGPGGLNILKDRDASGTVTIDDIEFVNIDLEQDGKVDQVEFFLDLGQDLTVLGTSIDFDIGLPGLGLDVEGDLEVLVGYEWNLAFGVSNRYGFYLLTEEEDEISVDFEIRTPDLRGRGELAFLQFDISDEDADSNPNNDGVDVDMDDRLPSSFVAGLTIDILDPIDDPMDPIDTGKLTETEIEKVFLGDIEVDDVLAIDLVGGAHVNLDLLVSFQGDVRFPSIGAEFTLDWMFAGSNGGEGLSGGVPTVAFNNVTINAGELISEFADGVLKQVKKFTEPIQPVVDFVTSPIPILSGFGFDFTPLDIARALGYATEADYVEAVADIISVVNSIPEVDDLKIPLGSFIIVQPGGEQADLRDENGLVGAMPEITEMADPVMELKMADEEAGDFFDDLHEMGIYLPILENPGSVFQLMLGQTVDLFLYDIPPLVLSFPFPIVKVGPLIPPIPLFASFSGNIGASLDLAVGFDTHGFEKARETGDWYDVFAGFFLSDTENPDGTGEDVPEATLFGNINAAAEISLVVVGAGVSGGVDLELFADLVDTNMDGKVHLDELIANIELGVTGTFDLGGTLTARLDAFVELLFKRINFTIAEIEIASFEFTDEDIFRDRFTGNNSMGAATFLGVAPGLHIDGLSLETTSDVDWYEFELLRTDSVDVDIRHSAVHGTISVEVYNEAGEKIAEGKSGQDRDVASLINVPAGNYFVRVSGSDKLNNYELAIEPGKSSSTRVIYVTPSGSFDRGGSYYTYAPGSDTFEGLNHRKPMASLQNVLDTYDLGPNDLVVFDTGVHAAGGVITAADSGAIFVGSVKDSTLSGITLEDADNNLFYRLEVLSSSPGLALYSSDNNVFDRMSFSGGDVNVLLENSDGNLFDRSTFAGSGDGLRILGTGSTDDAQDNIIRHSDFKNAQTSVAIFSQAPNRLELNSFTGTGQLGVHLPPSVPATLMANVISGRATGILWESRVASVFDNDLFNNTVGIEVLGAVVGPDNPTPFGTPGGAIPNRVHGNQTGIFVPEDSAGSIIRHTEIYSNNIGIEAHGDQTQILANDIHDNVTGILSDREIGPANWDADLHNLIHDNETGVTALAGAEVRFNRIFSNDVGVQVLGSATVHHNVIYRNAGDGILVSGARGVDLFSNTIFSPGQSGVHLKDFVSDVDIRNNIVMTTSGFGLRVEAESQFGYTSDYNNYFSTGGGGVAFQGKGFFDLYDWQVEAESDLHSLGTTVPDPSLDNPLFVDLANDDYHVITGSTSIDAGDPSSAFALEPLANGSRINLGAYGNTPQATTSPAQRLEITAPNFYVDLVPSQTYDIRWESNNIGAGVNLDIDLIQEGVGKIADVATVAASAGMTTWTPGSFVAGNNANRYRLRLTTLSGQFVVEESREPFAIPDFNPVASNTFYVNDGSTADDVYAMGVGSNRNTGLTAETPKVVIRPLVLSYSMGPGDTVLVDTGEYVHAVNLNLSSASLAFDPRMNTVSDTLITGPVLADTVAHIDRANPYLGSAAFDLIDAPNMTLERLTVVGAGIGVRARDGSDNLDATRLTLSDHGLDGLSIETASHDATLDLLTVFNNGRHGIFVDSRLISLSNSTVHDNEEIGVALRSVGATVVTRTDVYNNFRGMDVINPGPFQAVVGHADLAAFLGNRVHHNEEDGIFASGNVLVAGNTVNENANVGIRLDDGADALRNVVRQHVTGISARGSTSDITENRSFLNSVTGIEASYDSNILRNVTYNNGLHGIHADRFSGVIDHNLIYSTGYASMNVEGPGVGAQITQNTIYEPCDDNDESPGLTTVTTDWDPQILMQQLNPPGFPPFFTPLWGELTIEFGMAMGDLGGTLHLGPGGGTGALLSEPLPPGEVWVIDYEFVSMSLSSAMFEPIPGVGVVIAELAPDLPSTGQLVLENIGGTLVGTNHLELSFKFTFPEIETTLLPSEPLVIDYTIGPSSGFDAFEVLQVPTFIPPIFPPPNAFLFDPNQPSQQWRWEMQAADVTHGDPDPPPQDRGDTCAEIGIIIQNQSERVLLRQNAVFVEGDATTMPGDPNSVDIIVTDDSTFRWDSDFNAWMTEYGAVGTFANLGALDLVTWQSITNDDFHSIDPDWRDVWVDPDGDDDTLGGLTTGFDDNFHLRSPFGQVDQGALAPIEDFTPGGTGLPFFEAVIFETFPGTIDDLSPLIDAGEPAAPFLLETFENGQFANIGVYGNTDQASRSEPEYIHMVYPIGVEQIVPGRTYELRWRSHDYLPGDTVAIELRHGTVMGPLEVVISPAAANTGLFFWTVPPLVLADTDYVIVMRRPSVLVPGTDIEGVTPFLFEIGGDTRAPVVLGATPEVVELGARTNADISSITIEFSENVLGAGSALSYQLKSAGADGVFDDGGMSDDVLHSLLVTYTPGLSDADTSFASLTIFGGPLAEGDYRLTVSSSGIADLAGISLDGTMAGGSSDYVRVFTVDKTAPTVFIPAVVPNPRNAGPGSIDIVFDEEITGLGLADVRLTGDGGPNLLSGTLRFTTTDGLTWRIADTTGILPESSYTFDLTSANSLIRDLAGNPLVLDASTSWVVDTTPPALDIADVSPDPRATGVSQVTFVFSEEVFDFTLIDLRLLHSGQEITLAVGNAPTTSDNITWTVSNLAALTSAEGSYLLKAIPGGTLHDAAGNTLQAEVRDTWQVIATPPVTDVLDVSPDLRVDPVNEIVVTFNVPVTGFDLSDLRLMRNAMNVSLASLSAPMSLDGMNWHITGLTGVTSANGSYVFSVIAAGSGIQDLAGNPLAADATDNWVTDSVPPTVSISTVSPDPGNFPVEYIDFVFSKPVTGVVLENLTLSRNAVPIDWTEAQSVTTGDGITWRLNNLTSLTSADGNYTLTLDPGANLIEAFPGNPLVVGDTETWLIDATRPTVTITDVAPNAAFDATNSVQIVFSEPVTGLDTSDLVLTRRGFVVPLTGAQTLATSDNQTWTLTNLAPLTNVTGKYELSLRAIGAGIQDAAANALTVGTFETWRVLIPGDVSADNRVGLKDLGRIGGNFGMANPTPEQGDLDRDLSVGRADLVTLLGLYGTSLPPKPVVEGFDGSGAATFAALQADHAAFVGTPGTVITFAGLSGVISSTQFTSSHGLTFANLGAFGALPEGDPSSTENLDGYDGSYQPDGDTVYVSHPNHLTPLTFEFASPVAIVGSFVGTGTQGTPHLLTVTAFDAAGAILTTLSVPTQFFADAQNREGFWAVKADAAVISKITILNNNPVNFGNALIIDNIAWSALPPGSGSAVINVPRSHSQFLAAAAVELPIDAPRPERLDAAFAGYGPIPTNRRMSVRPASRLDRPVAADELGHDFILSAYLAELPASRSTDDRRHDFRPHSRESTRDPAASEEVFAELARDLFTGFESRFHRLAKVQLT